MQVILLTLYPSPPISPQNVRNGVGVTFHDFLGQMRPYEVYHLVADRIKAFTALLARVNLNQVVSVVGLTDGLFFTKFAVTDADLHSSPCTLSKIVA